MSVPFGYSLLLSNMYPKQIDLSVYDSNSYLCRIISNIVSVTMGERYSKYMGGGVHPTKEIGLNEPLHVSFVHEPIWAAPTCAYWSEDDHR